MARNLAALVWMTTSLAAAIAAPARAAPAAGAPAPGVYWEQAVELQMAGFSMPGQTVKVCLPKGAWKDPPQSDSRCKVTDLRKNGARMQWKVACADGTTGK